MVYKLLFTFMTGLLSLQYANAQKPNPYFSIDIESQFLIAGELNASFDFLAGAKGYYFFSSKKKINAFLSAGFASDIANTNARIINTDLQLGANWNFSQRFSLLMSLGGNYLTESHAHSLIEQDVIWKNTMLGITGNVGVNYHITESISSKLFIKQINLDLTSIGLGVNYLF